TVLELRREPNINDARPLYLEGIELHRTGKLREAYEALSEAADINPADKRIARELEGVRPEYAKQLLASARQKSRAEAIADTTLSLSPWPEFSDARAYLSTLEQEERKSASLLTEGRDALRTQDLPRAFAVFRDSAAIRDASLEDFRHELAMQTG